MAYWAYPVLLDNCPVYEVPQDRVSFSPHDLKVRGKVNTEVFPCALLDYSGVCSTCDSAYKSDLNGQFQTVRLYSLARTTNVILTNIFYEWQHILARLF